MDSVKYAVDKERARRKQRFIEFSLANRVQVQLVLHRSHFDCYEDRRPNQNHSSI